MRLRPALSRRGPGGGEVDAPEPAEVGWGSAPAPMQDPAPVSVQDPAPAVMQDRALVPVVGAVPGSSRAAAGPGSPAGTAGNDPEGSGRPAQVHASQRDEPMRLGVIDIGSNTVHLLVVDAHRGGQPQPAASVRIPLRLVELLDGEGRLADNGERALTACIHELRTHAQNLNVVDLVAFATSAVREAPDGDDVLARVRADTGLAVTVLPGEAEARLTFLAVRRWFGWSAGRLLALDIGGGSLEIGAGMHEDPDVVASLPLGASRLTRNWLGENDPPKRSELNALRRYVRAQIAPVVGSLYHVGEPTRAVATSKTFRSLARIAGAAPYGRGTFVRRSLRRADLAEVTARVCRMSAQERAALPGVSASRAGQLVAGAVVASEALDLFNLDEVEICPWALREGVILRRLDQLTSGLDGPRALPPVGGV
ncbi:Ppx/GppA family phosphatase [Parafrankia sp. EUN1f]|uniref:Ppx/GppA phosphatase family protein n=1 Tax=Parafrankia sp. EUN1f TaxID=102897 RepID=UPI001E3FF295|nr:Ppx/GppA family phosphatase [Parafrankia sp. EUN1f]